MGREKTTGRFDTREQLEERITFMYYQTTANISTIATACDVSPTTVDNILTEHSKRIHNETSRD